MIEETSGHTVGAVTTLRIPITEGNKRRITRLRGEKRRLMRRYLGWTNDQDLCGRQGERVVLESLKSAASSCALWVPPQSTGVVEEVNGVPVPVGPLDAQAQILDVGAGQFEVPLVVEVKNVRHWIYPWAPELWEMLVKVASVSMKTPVVSVLMAPHVAYQTYLLAQDVGILTCPYRVQVFRPTLSEELFEEVEKAFGLTIQRHEGPLDHIVTWLKDWLRKSPAPHPSSSPEEDVAFYRRQADRLPEIAPLILEFELLAADIDGDLRRRTFALFRTRLAEKAPWTLQGGY